MRNYIDLITIYEEDSFGSHVIITGSTSTPLSEKIKNFYSLTNEYEGYSEVFLFKDDMIVMCTTQFELATNKPFLDIANGDVLIIGLGLAMIVFPLLNDETISSITIVEKDLEVIQYIGNKVSQFDLEGKVSIVNGDAYDHYNNMDPNKKYDTIFLDFWNQLNKENIEEVTTVKENYRPFLKDQNSILLSWCEDIKHILIESFNP